MSTTSPQAKAASENSYWQAGLSKRLYDVAFPEMERFLGSGGMIDQMLAGRDASGRLPQDAAALRSATDQLNAGYGQAGFGNREYMNYAALRGGEGRLSPMAVGAAEQNAATSLERDRQQALANLNFMSAQSSMSDYNKLLGLMGQGVQTSLGLAQGFGGASNAAIGGMSGTSQMSGFLGGASSGAALGSTIMPGWGTAIGGVVGGLGGLLGSR